jgi:hypothetical protein
MKTADAFQTCLFGFALAAAALPSASAQAGEVRQSVVGEGWADNSVNVAVFRKNSLFTHGDTQYVAYYDGDRYMVLGKRKLGTGNWTVKRSPWRGNAADAHNVISIAVDGAGYLHVSWDQHNGHLHYARSVAPGSLELGAQAAMVGKDEDSVSYPEFYRMPNGDLLFFYRSGGSGRGDMVMNRYDLAKARWERLQTNLISGEGKRNAYWQAFLDRSGTIHLSWVWRETPDVATNHDMAYARSRDGGRTWEKSTGEKYALPITAENAEYALRIPQGSDLINQTSMSADVHGQPYIASYWRDAGSSIPQYHVLFKSGKDWQVRALDFRKTAFSLGGMGTKRVPIARPQIMVGGEARDPSGLLIFRDEERGDRVSAVKITDFRQGKWTVRDLTTAGVGSWEPTFDTERWRRDGVLSLFVQNVTQVDGEGKAKVGTRPVTVLDWKPD